MNNLKLYYRHINVTNMDYEKWLLEQLKIKKFFIMGIEVTRKEFNKYLHISIDPQHTSKNSKITSVEYIWNNYEKILEKIKDKNKIIMITIRPDIDSLASMALLTLMLQKKLKLNGDIILRLIAIAKSDRHGRNNWKMSKEEFFNFDNYNNFGLPSGLQYMCSDYKTPINKKINNIIDYLNTGEFKDLDKYNSLVNKNLKRSIKNTEVEVIIPNKLIFVSSKFRGATSKGYQSGPIVIAHNPKFNFGKGESKISGQKYTIAQYSEGHIDLNNVLNDILQLESNWGGSNLIIGSPQDQPSNLTKEQIIEILKNNLN